LPLNLAKCKFLSVSLDLATVLYFENQVYFFYNKMDEEKERIKV
jgi:hypothetical protein